MFNVNGGGGPLAQMAHAQVESPEAVLDLCTEKGIAYLPFFPLAVGQIANAQPALSLRTQRPGDRRRDCQKAAARHCRWIG